jgi:hypothetical protein
MAVDTPTVSFIVFPSSIVHITISMNQSSKSIGFSIDPQTFIHGAVWPNLSSSALPDFIIIYEPFSYIARSVF